MEHIFRNWETLKEKLRGKYLFIFLDYDGTLTPIVKTPEQAVLSKEIREILKILSENPYCKIAIISGRSLEDVKNKFNLRNLVYSGNHGLEIEGPKIKYITSVSSGYRKIINQIKDELSKKIIPFKGAFIEDKGLSIALHFRNVDQKQASIIKTIFHEVIIVYLVKNKIKVKPGKKVLEVRPPLEWDKGKVVLWLLARQKFARIKKEILSVYIGDDTTDEDAFKAIQRIGITILVGKTKGSHARYCLRNHDEVKEFLERIVKLQKEAI